MSKNDSNSTHEKIMPQGKPSASFITESAKTGEYGETPIPFSTLKDPGGDTSKSMTTDDFALGAAHPDMDGLKNIMPQGEPDSTFINTSAVK